MVCLLRVGFDDEEELDEALFAPVGDRFGTYRIERRDDGTLWELGRGAMGVTYRATDTSLLRPVALKLIDVEWIKRGAEARERFMREARAAAALRHPNVAAVYQFGIQEENGHYFCALELVEGETLEMRVRRTGPLDALTTVEIALQVTSALAAAEKQGLVHRDLKPANLMILAFAPEENEANPGKADPIVKVIDFGVAKALAEKPDAMGLTHGGFVGTPAFASPEQFTNAPVDVRSDIYSLGVTLWYLLTGRMPFPGASVEEIRASHQLHVLPIAQLKAARLPRCLISLLTSILALEPAARPGVRALTSKLRECRAQILDRWKAARRFALAAALLGLVATAFLLLPQRHKSGASENAASANAPEKSIAVLPFENLSQDTENAFFAGGVQDEILTHLAKIADLKVISRTSVMQYTTGAERNLREIGRQLGVAHLLEGSVQRDAKRVRVNAQLIDARTDAHLWAQTYDRDLADVFAIQSEIAKAIAGQLQAKLSPSEKTEIELRPTTNLAAFDLYTRAKTLRLATSLRHLDKNNLLQGADLLNQAVALDPAFFLAWCDLALKHDLLYFLGHDHTPARLALADAAVQTALRLRPDAGEAHLALANHLYHGYLDYDRARAELAIAQRTLPNEPLLFTHLGNIDRRQGRWAESTRNLERVSELDPRNINLNLAWNYESLRRYAEMAAVLDRALEIAPKEVEARIERARVDLHWRADPRLLQTTIEAILVEDPAARASLVDLSLLLALCKRDLAAVDRALVTQDDNPLALGFISLSRPFVQGLVARVRGDAAAARAAFTIARNQQEEVTRAQPDYAPAIGLLGLIDAGLGRKEEALREGRRAIELLPLTRDALGGADMIECFAIICAWIGEKDLALEQLAISARIPEGVHYGQLKLHPFWDPLRGDPRFEKIVASLAPKESAPPSLPEKSIAVLPFENLSSDQANPFPADGIHEDILASLSKVADLKLISPTSVRQYRKAEGATRNLPEIAKTLGVRNLLEGSVRRAGDRLIIKVQLTDALESRLVWAERYDRSIADSITLQGELAMEVAIALRARLSVEEKSAISAKPTNNPQAYILYLRAWENHGTSTHKGWEEFRMREKLYKEALALDPSFALAHAGLSIVLSYIYQDLEPTEANKRAARAAADEALRLQPDLGEAHFASAIYLYQVEKNYEGALRALETTARLLPNDARVETWVGFIRRRQGHWREAVDALEHALARDPHDRALLSGYFLTQYFLRDWAAARRAAERAIAGAAEPPILLRIERNYVSVWSAGDLTPLRESLAAVPSGVDPDGGVTLARWDAALMARDFAAAEQAMKESDLNIIMTGHGTRVPKAYFLGCVALARGDVTHAQTSFAEARPLMEAEANAAPLEPFRHAQLGLLYAFMKRKEDALREGERAVELAPIEKDAIYGAQMLGLLAAIYAQTGERDRAVALIERLLVTPAAVLPAFEGSITLHELRLRWHWDPLRTDTRFQKILQSPEPRTNYR